MRIVLLFSSKECGALCVVRLRAGFISFFAGPLSDLRGFGANFFFFRFSRIRHDIAARGVRFSFSGFNLIRFAEIGKKTTMKNTTKAIIPALFSFAVMSAQTLSADVFDFSGATPVYDDYRSTTEETEGKHYYEYEHNIVGFNYMNANWGTSQSPSWYYQWDGINVSTANDPSADTDISKCWEAGEKASYTSQNALDASGVSGGAYGVFYGNPQYPVTGHSESDNCMGMKEDDPGINHEFGFIIFDDLVNFQSISIANTLVTYDYLTKNLDDNEHHFTQTVIIYGVDSNYEMMTDNYVEANLSDAENGVVAGWKNVDLTSLNVEGGLTGLYFKMYTNNYNADGPLTPSYFAMDNIVYTSAAVPEAGEWAAILGAVALGFVALRRRSK